jgi:hypothetical protein
MSPVLVEIDVDVDGTRRHARHLWDGGAVTALTTTPGGTELLRYHHARWPARLAALVEHQAPPGAPAAPEAPPSGLDLPLELLLGSGEAIRRERHDLLAELMARHPTGLDPQQLRRLHTGCLGRMRAVVCGVSRTGARRAGWVSWALFADGWRALTPHTSGGVARVRVHRVDPDRLPVEVARLMTTVRA